MGVIVFSMENCAGCTTVKNILKSKGVEYTERDVNNIDHMEEAEQYRVRSLPTIVIRRSDDDFSVISGSSQRSLELLNKELEELI